MVRQRILEFVRKYISERGYSPTVREIGKAVGLSSTATVHKHLTILSQEGRISWIPDAPRTIHLATLDKSGNDLVDSGEVLDVVAR